MKKVAVDGRLPDESAQLQTVLREMVAPINVMADRFWVNAGSPEGVIAAPIGALYLRTDGGTATSLYVKESNSGLATGWVAK